ncbi:MAG TPA: hypothetical protein VGR51_08895, partial [Thermoplasmata archaeon]|nr:hypothetical protein [Thermoplasmata archaeon]
MASPPTPPRARDRTHLFLFAILLVVFLIISIAVWYVLNESAPEGPAPFVDFANPVLGGPGDATVAVQSVGREVGLGSFRVSLVNLGTSATVFDAALRVGTLYSDA